LTTHRRWYYRVAAVHESGDIRKHSAPRKTGPVILILIAPFVRRSSRKVHKKIRTAEGRAFQKRHQHRRRCVRILGFFAALHMAALGPLLPSATCGRHGSYRGISCRTWPS
jgi:hypothetical protein